MMEPEIVSLSTKQEMIPDPESIDVNSVSLDDSETPASPSNVEEMDLMDEISVTTVKNDSLKSTINNEFSQVMNTSPSQNDNESKTDELSIDEKCTSNNSNENNDALNMNHRSHTISESDDKLMIDEKVTDVNYNGNDESDAPKDSIQSSPNSPEESHEILSPGPIRHSDQETPHSPEIEHVESPSSTLQDLRVETVERKSPSPTQSPEISKELRVETVERKSLSPPQSPEISQDLDNNCILNSPTPNQNDTIQTPTVEEQELPSSSATKELRVETVERKSPSPPQSPEVSQDSENNCILNSPTPNQNESTHTPKAKEQELPMEVEEDNDSKEASRDDEEKEEEEDLEDGEIEDDEEEGTLAPKPETTSKETVISFKSIIAKEGSDKEKHRHKDKDKEKDSRKDKENKSSDKKRKHEDESSSKRERRGSSSDKSSRKRARKGEEEVGEIEDDDLLLNVRGASPSKSPTGGAGAGTKYYGEEGSFGRHSFEDENGEYGASPDDRRRRRSRSPLGRRRGTDDRSSSRRPASGRKEPIKPAHKSDQICAYYMQGKCQKSHEECSFSHNAVPPRKMELCKFWMMDCCAKREKCLYLHNDFPCKFYHTGLVCKAGLKGQCKFSHKPLNEVTKAVLLKHIETAPKEILGDFPRLNRQGALNLMAKMEAKIAAEIAREKEREDMDHRRRSRWEVPTRDDQQKLHELMEEAGIGNLYEEAVQDHPRQDRQERQSNSHHHSRSQQPPLQPNQGSKNKSSGMLPIPPPIGIPPPGIGLLHNSGVSQPNVVNNPALANVLANLHIPSTTIRPPPPITQQLGDNDQRVVEVRTRSRSPELKISSDEPPDHLPPVQKEIFRRLQEQQKKNANKALKNEQSDEEKPDESGWYSSDEDTDKPITDVLKEVSEKADAEKKPPVVDFASVLSAIRKNAAAAAAGLNNSSSNLSETTLPVDITGRGDVDFRFPNSSSQGPNSSESGVSSKQGPFGDMDFRVPSIRPEFKDIDLRLTGSPTNSDRRSPQSLFKSLPTGPATMIDASISSHPPMTWKVHVVAGVKKPDYNYVRHTLTAAAIAMDPRFGPRTGGISILPDPGSPPSVSNSKEYNSAPLLPPATIPGNEMMMDPRMNRRATSTSVSDPRLSGDPRSVPINPHIPIQSQPPPPTNMLPPGMWPNNNDMTQAALAAQFMAASQLGLLGPYPNAGGIPFAPPDFSGAGNNPAGLPPGLRPGFHGGPRVSAPPSSSWERYHSQQQSGGVTPPI